MKLLYFTTEDLSSGLFENQVLENLYGLLDRDPNIRITLLLLNKPGNFLKHQRLLRFIRRRITVIYLPLSPPMRFFTTSIIINKLYIAYCALVFRLVANPYEYDVIHCRHYFPSLVCQKLGVKHFHFDIRSLSLFEYVQAGKIKEGSLVYDYWQEQEDKLVHFADGVSVVSRSMIPYFTRTRHRAISYCPIIVNSQKIYPCEQSRVKYRNQWNWDDKKIYVYSGSFGLYGLNKDYLAKLIWFVIKNDSTARFLFLLSNSEKEYSEFLAKFGLPEERFRYLTVESNVLYQFMSSADVGIHALPPQLDAFSRLGTKVVEYWCCGLPTLINTNVGEACDIARKFNFGKVLDLDNLGALSNDVLDFKRFDNNYIREKSVSLFDKTNVLDTYIRSYLEIIEAKRART